MMYGTPGSRQRMLALHAAVLLDSMLPETANPPQAWIPGRTFEVGDTVEMDGELYTIMGVDPATPIRGASYTAVWFDEEMSCNNIEVILDI